MDQADLIWHNGELVAWEDAKVHVLSHGLHYGTGVFEGVRAYETDQRHRRSSATRTTSTACSARPSSTTCRSRTRAEELRQATHELLIAERPARVLHPPDRVPRLRRDGPATRSRRRSMSRSPRGRGAPTSARTRKQIGIRAKVSSWRRMHGDSVDPAGQGHRQYLNSILAKIEATKAGYEEAILLDPRGFVCEGSGENIFLVDDGNVVHAVAWPRGDPRRDHPPLGDPDRPRPRLRGRRARHRPRRAVPGRRGVHDRHRG